MKDSFKNSLKNVRFSRKTRSILRTVLVSAATMIARETVVNPMTSLPRRDARAMRRLRPNVAPVKPRDLTGDGLCRPMHR